MFFVTSFSNSVWEIILVIKIGLFGRDSVVFSSFELVSFNCWVWSAPVTWFVLFNVFVVTSTAESVTTSKTFTFFDSSFTFFDSSFTTIEGPFVVSVNFTVDFSNTVVSNGTGKLIDELIVIFSSETSRDSCVGIEVLDDCEFSIKTVVWGILFVVFWLWIATESSSVGIGVGNSMMNSLGAIVSNGTTSEEFVNDTFDSFLISWKITGKFGGTTSFTISGAISSKSENLVVKIEDSDEIDCIVLVEVVSDVFNGDKLSWTTGSVKDDNVV